MRVVLVDFAVVDMFQCGILVPYLQGLLRERGIEVLTIRFGVQAGNALDRTARVVLKPQELASLSDACRGAHTIVFSHPPSDAVQEAARAAGVLSLYWFGFLDDQPLQEEWMKEAWGIGETELLEAVPDYAYLPANPQAASLRPLPYVLLGDECGYHRGLQSNPWFKGVSFPAGVSERGCTFCAMGERTVSGHFDEQSARRALRAAVETAPWGSFRKRIRIVGSQFLGRLEQLVDWALTAADREDLDVLLGGRVDAILLHEHTLRRALEALRPTGCRIQFNLIGVENFSVTELNRFNKGITPTQIVNLLLLLRRLKKRFPDHFDCDEYGGLSLILFTPWTSLEDLRYNYNFVKLAQIRTMCNKLYSSRLRLRPNIPLTWLAERDGLLVDGYTDPLFDKARHSFYPEEMPWRFADPRVEAFNRISMRLETCPTLESDDMYRQVQAWLDDRKFAGPLDAAIALVGELEASGETDSYELMQAVRRTNRQKKTSSDFMQTKDFWRSERHRFDQEGRRAAKIEVAYENQLDRLAALAEEHFGHVESVDSPHGGSDLYYADSPGNLARLKDASERMYRADNERNLRDSIRESGTLLGYPSCCVEAYTRDQLHHVPHQIFNWLLRRYQRPVAIPPVVNPFFRTVFHVPCSCNCQATEEMLDAEKGSDGLDPLAVVFLLPIDLRAGARADGIESLANCVLVEPVRDEPSGFSYRAVEKRGADFRLDYVMEGNRLDLDQGRLSIRRNGRRLYTFCLEAQVWYHRRAFDIAFWRPFIGHLVYRHIDLATTRTTADPDPSIDPPPRRYLELQKKIESTLGGNHRAVFGEGFRFAGTRVGNNRVQVLFTDLRENNGPLELMFQYKQDAEEFYLVGESLAICLPPGVRITGHRVDSLVHGVLSAVEAILPAQAGCR